MYVLFISRLLNQLSRVLPVRRNPPLSRLLPRGTSCSCAVLISWGLGKIRRGSMTRRFELPYYAATATMLRRIVANTAYNQSCADRQTICDNGSKRYTVAVCCCCCCCYGYCGCSCSDCGCCRRLANCRRFVPDPLRHVTFRAEWATSSMIKG